MSTLNILYYPDPRLRTVAEPVKKVDKKIQHIVDDMFKIMYKEEGIGLAATQVNIHQRIIVIDISEAHNDKLILINPIILKTSGKTGIEEGCLSIPKQRAFIPRAKWIKIRALDINEKEFELEADNLLAICIQHEIDHLNGKLFLDYLSTLKRQLFKQKIKKLERLKVKTKK